MPWDIKKFNKEIHLLKALGEERLLHPLRQEQIKQAVLAQANTQPQPAIRSFVWQNGKRALLRYLTPALLGISLMGGTVYASSGAVPGDKLFPVKKAKEKVEHGLAVTEQQQAKVEARHAEKRMEELEKIRSRTSPATPSAPESLRLKTETESHTETEVNHAIETLQTVRTKLRERGNTQAAEALDQTIKKLGDKAQAANLSVQIKTEGNKTEIKFDDKNDGQKDDSRTEGRKQEQSSDKNETKVEVRSSESGTEIKVENEIRSGSGQSGSGDVKIEVKTEPRESQYSRPSGSSNEEENKSDRDSSSGSSQHDESEED